MALHEVHAKPTHCDTRCEITRMATHLDTFGTCGVELTREPTWCQKRHATMRSDPNGHLGTHDMRKIGDFDPGSAKNDKTWLIQCQNLVEMTI